MWEKAAVTAVCWLEMRWAVLSSCNCALFLKVLCFASRTSQWHKPSLSQCNPQFPSPAPLLTATKEQVLLPGAVCGLCAWWQLLHGGSYSCSQGGDGKKWPAPEMSFLGAAAHKAKKPLCFGCRGMHVGEFVSKVHCCIFFVNLSIVKVRLVCM